MLFNDALYAYNQAEKEVYNDVGENSIAPIIDENGMWAFWSTELQEFIPSEFSAEGGGRWTLSLYRCSDRYLVGMES